MVKKILFLAANPKTTRKLNLDREFEKIKTRLEQSQNSDRFELTPQWNVRPQDWCKAMWEEKPQIVHFAGHGEGEPGLVLEDDFREKQLTKAEVLAELFNFFAGQVECIVLNACYSKVQAEAICQHIDYVIGMNQRIGDRSAIEFSVGLYEALGAGKSVETAYKWGCNRIRMQGISGANTPNLIQQDSGYVKRPLIEERCYNTLLQPGALLRIKAPKGMGKTMLISRLLVQLANQGYRTIHLNLEDMTEQVVFQSLDKFLQWLCICVGSDLQVENKLAQYWDEQFSTPKVNCTTYFEQYLLPQDNSKLVLCLNSIDRVFPHSDIASEFLGLLRAWHEKAAIKPIWQKLRLVVVHSTNVYISLKINESPFNAGLPIELPEFSSAEVENLAQRYQLDFSPAQVSQLMDLVGGRPYLINKALSYLRDNQTISLEQPLQTALTKAGIYGEHLRRLWDIIQQDFKLKEVLKKVLTTEQPMSLESKEVYILEGMGLLRRQGNMITFCCNLYRQYFCDRLGVAG